MRSRGVILLGAFLGIVIAAWLVLRNSSPSLQQPESPAVAVDKEPVAFANHAFDPNSPPAGMPTLAYGEEALCDSNFSSNTNVGGTSLKKDATHATVTITRVKMTLRLSVNIWVPNGVTQHVAEHEDGHRQISEYYYQTADKLAEQIATSYLGKQIDISGADLDEELEKVLHQTAVEITGEYDRELASGAAQQYFDVITDHGRNESDVKESVAAAIEHTKIVAQ